MLCGKTVVLHIARCIVVYFNPICAVSSRASVITQGPGGESRDVDDDEQQLPLKVDRGIDTRDISRCGDCGGIVAIELPAAAAGRKGCCVYGMVRD